MKKMKSYSKYKNCSVLFDYLLFLSIFALFDSDSEEWQEVSERDRWGEIGQTTAMDGFDLRPLFR